VKIEYEVQGMGIGCGGVALLRDEKYIYYGMCRMCHRDRWVTERLQKQWRMFDGRL